MTERDYLFEKSPEYPFDVNCVNGECYTISSDDDLNVFELLEFSYKTLGELEVKNSFLKRAKIDVIKLLKMKILRKMGGF